MTDAFRDLNQEDLDLIQDVLRYYPGVREILSIAKVVDAAGYPVNSREDLLSIAPRGLAEFQFAGRKYDHAAVRLLMPAYYFPIASRSDLIAKLVEMHRITRTRRRAAAQGPRGRTL